MPWQYPDNVPKPSKNWDAEAQRKCTAAANAVLQDGDWEDAGEGKKRELEKNAIFACIRAAGKSKKIKEIPAEVVLELAEQNPELSDFQLVEKALGEGQGVGGPKQGVGGTDVCICSECDYETEHKRDTPCVEMKCPKCGETLVGKEEKTVGEGRGVGGERQGESENGEGALRVCVCPECGEKVEHERDTLCAEVKCPKCGAMMEGWETEEKIDEIDIIEEKIIASSPLFSKFFSLKGKDDKDYWVAVSGGAFRDREDEIVSRKAIDYGVNHGDTTGQRGELRLYHYPNSCVGSCTFQMRQGNFLIEAGLWDDTVRAQKAKEWVVSNDPGASVGFFYNPKKFVNGVYMDEVIFFERSILKMKHASFPWSNIETINRRLKAMSHKEELVEMIGEQEAKAVLEGAEEASKALEAQGIAFKESEDTEEKLEKVEKEISLEGMSEDELRALYAKIAALLRKSEPEEKEEKKKEVETEVQTFQLDEAAIKAIAEAVRETLPDNSELEAKVKALEESAVKSAEELAEQVETKVKEVFEDLPKATIYRATKIEEEVPEVTSQWVNPLKRSFEDGIRTIEQAREAGR